MRRGFDPNHVQYRSFRGLREAAKAFDQRLTAVQRVRDRFGGPKAPNSLTIEVEKAKALKEISATLTGTFPPAAQTLWRITLLCPCLDYWSKLSSYESSHSTLPKSWERLFAPCKCSFIKESACGREETSIGSDGKRRIKPCPLRKWQRCRFRILYINHITGESTLHCPCTTCRPDWRRVPCVTLASLFGEVEPTHSKEATVSDPLIPTQDLTRVGKPCWRLGDLFDELTTGSPDLDGDPVIPA